MARPRSFDPDAVLKAARDLFWSRGYHAASLDELARLTGVNKPSLYAAFGDKAALFLRVLDGYHAGLLRLTRQVLESEASPKRSLRAWLLGFLSVCSGERGERGCLSVNTSLEAAVISPKVRERLDRHQAETEALLRAAFERGIAADEFPEGFDAAAAARALLAAQYGLMVLARGRPPAADTLAAMERLLGSIVGSA
jgi:TetR/AcrR family transcriptional regulator, transcriptional repressor for nem operon